MKIKLEHIRRAACEIGEISVAEIKSARRAKHIIDARQIAFYLAKSLTSCSYSVIGNAFGGKDHTTVLYACRVIPEKLEEDAELKQMCDRIRRLSISLAADENMAVYNNDYVCFMRTLIPDFMKPETALETVGAA